MKFFRFCKIIFILSLVFTNSVFAKKTKRQIRKEKIIYPMPNDSECLSEIDYCFHRYCFDKKTLNDGVYSKCGAISPANILINVEECLKTRSVIKELDLTKGCKKNSYTRVLSLIENKDKIEKGLIKNTKSCQYATNMLQAAKNCYAIMISSDGSFSRDIYEKLNNSCGEQISGEADMVKRFFNAGDYGLSDVDMVNALRASGQNTVKRENWRQVVDATLAGYMEIAELSCGEEDYKITKVNDYLLDSRNNLSMIKMKEEAKQVGKKLGDKFVDKMFPGQACKSQPLPNGGLMWYYSQNSNPSCRIVCKEGYVVSRSFTKCVEPIDTRPIFNGINLGYDKLTANQGVVAFTGNLGKGSGNSDGKDATKQTDESKNGYSAEISERCKKNKKPKYEQYNNFTKKGICSLFVSQSSSWKEYERCSDTPERFYIDGKWYNFTIDKLNEIFSQNFERMGYEYASDMSKYLRDNCETILKENDPQEEVETEVSGKDGCITVKKFKALFGMLDKSYKNEFIDAEYKFKTMFNLNSVNDLQKGIGSFNIYSLKHIDQIYFMQNLVRKYIQSFTELKNTNVCDKTSKKVAQIYKQLDEFLSYLNNQNYKIHYSRCNVRPLSFLKQNLENLLDNKLNILKGWNSGLKGDGGLLYYEQSDKLFDNDERYCAVDKCIEVINMNLNSVCFERCNGKVWFGNDMLSKYFSQEDSNGRRYLQKEKVQKDIDFLQCVLNRAGVN